MTAEYTCDLAFLLETVVTTSVCGSHHLIIRMNTLQVTNAAKFNLVGTMYGNGTRV